MSKRIEYSEFELRFSALSNALGHPIRIAIIFAVIRKNNLIEREIIKIDNLSRIVINKHLMELKKAGLIVGQIKGLNCSYSVDKSVMYEYQHLVSKFKSTIVKARN